MAQPHLKCPRRPEVLFMSYISTIFIVLLFLLADDTLVRVEKTVVPAGAASDMLDTVPVRNVRGLGGKLGEAVVSWSKAETASDLKVLSLVAPCLTLVAFRPFPAGH